MKRILWNSLALQGYSHLSLFIFPPCPRFQFPNCPHPLSLSSSRLSVHSSSQGSLSPLKIIVLSRSIHLTVYHFCPKIVLVLQFIFSGTSALSFSSSYSPLPQLPPVDPKVLEFALNLFVTSTGSSWVSQTQQGSINTFSEKATHENLGKDTPMASVSTGS